MIVTPVDTSDAPTAILNASQLESLDMGIQVIVALLVILVLVKPTMGVVWRAWSRRRRRKRLPKAKAVSPMPVPLEDRIIAMLKEDRESMVIDIVAVVNTRVEEILMVVNDRANQNELRVNALSLEVSTLAAGQERLRQAIHDVDGKAEKAQETQAQVVNALGRAATGPHGM